MRTPLASVPLTSFTTKRSMLPKRSGSCRTMNCSADSECITVTNAARAAKAVSASSTIGSNSQRTFMVIAWVRN